MVGLSPPWTWARACEGAGWRGHADGQRAPAPEEGLFSMSLSFCAICPFSTALHVLYGFTLSHGGPGFPSVTFPLRAGAVDFPIPPLNSKVLLLCLLLTRVPSSLMAPSI